MTTDDASADRQRIIDAAYEVFSREGVRTPTDEEITTAAGVSVAILREHFPGREDLALVFLNEREMRWTRGMVEKQARDRGKNPDERLLAIFDVFDDWFHRDGFDACTFIKVLVEVGPQDPLGQASIRHLEVIREVVAALATEAGIGDPEAFAKAWHILMKGSIISATEGDKEAAKRAKPMAAQLIAQYRSQGDPQT